MSQYQPFNQRNQGPTQVPQNQATQNRQATVIQGQSNLGKYLFF